MFGVNPDGSVVISRTTPTGREIALADAATGDILRSIVDVPGDENVYHAAVDPSGRRLLYLAGRTDRVPLRQITIGDDLPVELPVTVRGAEWLFAGVTPELDSLPPASVPEASVPLLKVPVSTLPPAGEPPADEAAARAAAIEVFSFVYGPWTTVAEVSPFLDDAHDQEGLQALVDETNRRFPGAPAGQSADIREVRFTSPTSAVVRYDYTSGIGGLFPNRVGEVVLVDGTWKVTRATVCNDSLEIAGLPCPP